MVPALGRAVPRGGCARDGRRSSFCGVDNIKTKAAISKGYALQEYQQDQETHSCEKTVVVCVEEDLATIAHTFSNPFTMMREALTTEVTLGTVED